jgi:hypothetical protein
MKNKLYEGTYKRRKSHFGRLEAGKLGFFCVNFGQFSRFWIRIRILNTDPGPGEPNQCGF